MTSYLSSVQMPASVLVTRAQRSVIEALAGQDDELDARRRRIVRATPRYQRLIANGVDPEQALNSAEASVLRTGSPWWDARRLRKIQRERDAISERARAILHRPAPAE